MNKNKALALKLFAALVLALPLLGCGKGAKSPNPITSSDIASDPSRSDVELNVVVPPLYRVGGSVSGLDAPGRALVLRNNDTDEVRISANGPFFFTKFIKNAETYHVEISKQPDGMTCTLVNAIGVVDTKNVDTIDVTCVDLQTPLFVVGGMVEGLSGSVVLRNNGSDDVTIVSNGWFEFPVKMQSGLSYNVVVALPSPNQICTVTNATGTIQNRAVTNIKVVCANKVFSTQFLFVTAKGLQSDLMLQNYGRNNLTVYPNGNSYASAKFATSLIVGEAYLITVAKQPQSPSQTCVVGNGSGVVSAGLNIITVNCTTNKYSISGVVNGLKGSGLEITVNGAANEASINADGVLRLNRDYFSGESVLLKIERQPSNPTQVCQLEKSNFTVVNAPITDIVVNCLTNPRSVSVRILGLADNVIVVTNNGGDEIVASRPGSYAFKNKVESAANYKIAIKGSPTNASQTCTVHAGVGTVADDDVWEPSVICLPGWIGGSYFSGSAPAKPTSVRTLTGGDAGFEAVASSYKSFSHANQYLVSDGKFLYLSQRNNTIRSIHMATGDVTTLAGAANMIGHLDGIGTAATFADIRAIATDGVALYVAESNVIRKIDLASTEVTTLTGNVTQNGIVDGDKSVAQFNRINAIFCDGALLYVADETRWFDSVIRIVNLHTGEVKTVFGKFDNNTSLLAVDGVKQTAVFDSIGDLMFDGVKLFSSEGDYGRVGVTNIATGVVTSLPYNASFDSQYYMQFLPISGVVDGSRLFVSQRAKVMEWNYNVNTLQNWLGPFAAGNLDGPIGEAGVGSFRAMITDGTRYYIFDESNYSIRVFE